MPTREQGKLPPRLPGHQCQQHTTHSTARQTQTSPVLELHDPGNCVDYDKLSWVKAALAQVQ